MSPIITVVIPVYNGEKYISRAVESVINQPQKEAVEIIIVDDGSIDQSGSICDKLADKYPNIRVLHKKNGGVSSARNLGIQNVVTKYVAFLDCDDWWEPDFLDISIVNEFTREDSADIYQFSCQEMNNTYSLVKQHQVKDEELEYSKPGLGKYDWTFTCAFIYSTMLLKTYKILFPDARIGEDVAFTDMVFFHVRKLKRINHIIYTYWENASSCMHTAKCIERIIEGNKANIQKQEYLKKYKCDLDLDSNFLWSILNELPRLCAENDYQSVVEFMSEYCYPILERRPDLCFREELWNRLKAWRSDPKSYWRVNKIRYGIPLRIKQGCYQIPGMQRISNYVFHRYYRGFVPYRKKQEES